MEIVLGIFFLVLVGWALHFWKVGRESAVEQALVGETAKVEVSDVKVTTLPKLPTAKKLAEMTKAQLVDLGTEFGVSVNKGLKKDELILDLKAKVKDARKGLK